MTAFFVSDLHLDAARPDITEQFIEFLNTAARTATAFYILGDLFEAWIGDDDPDAHSRSVIAGLRAFTARGISSFLLHGNRDFLIGKRFCQETGVRFLPDRTVVDVFGRRVLLLHGDALCTDDHAYQRLRRIVQNPLSKLVLRSLPLSQRRQLALRMRVGSQAHIERADKQSPYIMDVNTAAVVDAFERSGVDCMIHGHTHRPAVHTVVVGARAATRIVLGDWYTQGSVLKWDTTGFDLMTLARGA